MRDFHEVSPLSRDKLWITHSEVIWVIQKNLHEYKVVHRNDISQECFLQQQKYTKRTYRTEFAILTTRISKRNA